MPLSRREFLRWGAGIGLAVAGAVLSRDTPATSAEPQKQLILPFKDNSESTIPGLDEFPVDTEGIFAGDTPLFVGPQKTDAKIINLPQYARPFKPLGMVVGPDGNSRLLVQIKMDSRSAFIDLTKEVVANFKSWEATTSSRRPNQFLGVGTAVEQQAVYIVRTINGKNTVVPARVDSLFDLRGNKVTYVAERMGVGKIQWVNQDKRIVTENVPVEQLLTEDYAAEIETAKKMGQY